MIDFTCWPCWIVAFIGALAVRKMMR